MLARGYDVTTCAIWIVLHSAVVVTGLLGLRGARSAAEESTVAFAKQTAG